MTTIANIGRPNSDEYAPYFETYLSHVPEQDVISSLEKQLDELQSVLGSISDEEASKLHGPYTWTIKQVLGHLIDNECIFAYRARCFASEENPSLPGYEQDDYVANSDYTQVSVADLLKEFTHLRQAFLCFCKRLPEEKWTMMGKADGKAMSVRAVAFLQVGHVRHHFAIVKRRLAGEV